jgi:hypothetical protein
MERGSSPLAISSRGRTAHKPTVRDKNMRLFVEYLNQLRGCVVNIYVHDSMEVPSRDVRESS